MIEGSVSVTLDTLAFDSELLIHREIDLPVSLNLCARPGCRPSPTCGRSSRSRTRSRSAAVGSRRRCPGAEARASHSTSDSGTRGVEVEAHRHGCDLQRARGGDLRARTCSPARSRTIPRTRRASCWWVAGVPAPTGHDKTSIVCFQREDQPGSLLQILQEFAARAINLTKLESRPTKRGLGDYCFFIDCEGHIADEVMADALRNLVAKQAEVKFLGSYPVAGPQEAGVRGARPRDARGRAAAAWVETLRAQIREPPRSTSDRSQAAARRAGVPARHRTQAGARRFDRRGARSRRARTGSSCRTSKALRAARTRPARRSAKAAPTSEPAKIAGRGQAEGRARGAGEGARRRRRAAARARTAGAEPGRRVRFPTAARTKARSCASSATRRRRRRSTTRAFSEAMGFVDTPRAAEASGSRFAYIMREGALLELALVNYAMSTIVRHGFVPVDHAHAGARAHDGGGRVLPHRSRPGVRRRRR